jgi:hypothetical protein
MAEIEWIPVSDRSPDEDGEYFVTYQTRSGARFTTLGDFEDGEWMLYGDASDHIVVAWIETPAPYDGQKGLGGLPLFS